jgi:hypothetical protein
LNSPCGNLGPRVDAQSGQDAADVILHGAFAYYERLCDLAVTESAHNQHGDFALSRTQGTLIAGFSPARLRQPMSPRQRPRFRSNPLDDYTPLCVGLFGRGIVPVTTRNRGENRQGLCQLDDRMLGTCVRGAGLERFQGFRESVLADKQQSPRAEQLRASPNARMSLSL